MAGKRNSPIIAVIIVTLVVLALAAVAFKSQQIQNTINSPAPSVSPQPSLKEATTSAAEPALSVDKLQKYFTVQAALLGVSDNVSIYFKDLKSPREIGIDSVRSWIPASTIKSFVVLEAYRQRQLGLINFDDQVTISADNVVPTELETDDFPKLREDTVAPIGQLVAAMIEQSDNTAYNTLLDILDRRNINQTLRNLGITETVVGQKLNLDANQAPKDEQTPGYQLNTTTAKDLATFFNLLYDKKVASSDEILAIFEKQKINNMIPAFLPKDTLVAHKTGDLAPIYHDGGLIFKQNNPFVISIFTNSNDPTIVAKLAEVAYFQDAATVGKPQAKIPMRSYLAQSKTAQAVQALAQNLSGEVLAAEDGSTNTFPNITAADLGITAQDLSPEKAAAIKIGGAIFTPGTIFYDIKKFVEDTRLKLARNNSQKIATNLDISKDRLSEVKSTLKSGDIQTAKTLITQSENNMKKSIDLSQNGKPSDADLLKIKQVSDLHYATLAEVASSVPTAQKEAFVDMAYNFYTQNKKEIKPTITKSLTKTSPQQEPIIGTVAKVTSDTVTVKFDDGSTRDVVTNGSVPSRQFASTKIETQTTPQEGTRIAIVGQTTTTGKIIPAFILKNIPKAFPDKKTGTVIQVDPAKSTLQIQDNAGKTQDIKVNEDTVVKSKDTNVSVEGIKPGSQVTVFGTTAAPGQNASPATSPKPASSPTNTKPQSSPQNTAGPTKPAPTKPAPPPAKSTGPSINANTVTVTKNSSGKSEPKKNDSKPSSSTPQKSSPSSAPPPQAPKVESPGNPSKK